MKAELNHDLSLFYDEFWKLQGVDNAGENYAKFLLYPSVGIVLNTDDPLQMGRVQVFCPAYGDNPKKLLHLPWCAYASAFGGSIKNKCFTRGVKDGPEKSTGAVQYGFWAVPEQGAHVVVGCLDGDPKRRFYFGSLPEHQETHTLFHGRYKWGEGGIPNGPLTSDGEPIEPAYTNLGKAFQDDRTSREWKTRVADYQATAVREDVGEVPNDTKDKYLDQQYDKISDAEQDDWVKPILGAHGYDWTGFKGTGAFLSSRAYGFSTPGFHAWSMDDRAFNSRIKLRSATGHQIIMDDTNERIYIMTNKGKSWVELDSSGNIDVYSDKRISMHAKQDINFTTDETFRVHAKKGIHMYAGNNISQEDLEAVPNDGEIRIQAEDDFHLITNKNMRWYSYEDSLFEIGGKKCESIGDSYYLHVQNDIHTITNYGSYFLSISADINEIVNGSVKRYALGNQAYAADGDFESFAFGGQMDIGSQRNFNIKSIAEDITVESMGSNTSSSGGVFIKTPRSQQGISNKGIFMATKEKIRGRSEEDTDFEVGNTNIQDRPTLEDDDLLCEGVGQIDLTGLTGADLAAAAAHNAGFRGNDLLTAVAIAGGESSYNPNARNGADASGDGVWGSSQGLWQVRTLNQNPNNSTYRGDHLRVNDGSLYNAQQNANVAALISNLSANNAQGQGADFGAWTVYREGIYRNYEDLARQAIANVCGGGGPMSYSPSSKFTSAFSAPLGISSDVTGCVGQTIRSMAEDFIDNCLESAKTALIIKSQKMIMKAVDDLEFKIDDTIIGTSVKSIVGKITELVGFADGIGAVLEAAFPAISAALSALGGSISLPAIPTGWLAALDALGGDIAAFFKPLAGLLDMFDDIIATICDPPNVDIPFFKSVSQSIFYYDNHDLIGCLSLPDLGDIL